MKSAVVVWGILPKGMSELKKRVLKDNVPNIIRSGKYYKPSFLEKDHLGRKWKKGPCSLNLKGRKRKKRKIGF